MASLAVSASVFVGAQWTLPEHVAHLWLSVQGFVLRTASRCVLFTLHMAQQASVSLSCTSDVSHALQMSEVSGVYQDEINRLP